MQLPKRLFAPLACLTLLSTGLSTGCAAYQMEAPKGFAEVRADRHMAHYKGGRNVGLSVRVFDNVEGGSLDFWTQDLEDKLGRRGYEALAQREVKSANGVVGRQLDYRYRPDEQTDKLYTVMLFASEDHRVVVQLAGDPEPMESQQAGLDELLSKLKVR